jgi:hypothetical protein
MPVSSAIAQALTDAVAPHFARHIAAARRDGADGLAVPPDATSIAAMVDAAFWASLRREEGYVPTISLAYLSPRMVKKLICASKEGVNCLRVRVLPHETLRHCSDVSLPSRSAIHLRADMWAGSGLLRRAVLEPCHRSEELWRMRQRLPNRSTVHCRKRELWARPGRVRRAVLESCYYSHYYHHDHYHYNHHHRRPLELRHIGHGLPGRSNVHRWGVQRRRELWTRSGHVRRAVLEHCHRSEKLRRMRHGLPGW